MPWNKLVLLLSDGAWATVSVPADLSVQKLGHGYRH